MEISFTGDIFFSDALSKVKNPFSRIQKELKNPIINLESVFLPDSYKKDPVKKKVCLRQNNASVSGLKLLRPRLINLANNHLNDFGNFGAENTMDILKKNKLDFFGIGYENEDHNVYVDKKLKVVFYTYCTRSADLTGSRLFNDKKNMGPKEFSFELFKRQSRRYPALKKVVLFHWGIEHTHYPMPEQVEIARKLIDEGVDLIIGNHSHTIQSYENHKGRWIFYSLGNFYFPEFTFTAMGRTYRSEYSRQNKISIVPAFSFSPDRDIKLSSVRCYIRDKDDMLRPMKKVPSYTRLLTKDIEKYRRNYKLYMAGRFAKKAATFPYRRLKRAIVR